MRMALLQEGRRRWLSAAALLRHGNARDGCLGLRQWSSKSRSKAPSSGGDESDIDEERMEVKVSEDTCSYGVRKVKEWIKSRELNYEHRSRHIVDPLLNTGLYVDFPYLISMSVETHPSVCISNFAETALMPTLETVEDPHYTKGLESPRLILLEPMGYSRENFCVKHKEANDLYDHILKLRKLLLKATFVDGIVEFAGGEVVDLRAPAIIKAEKAKRAAKEQIPIYVKTISGPA